jgi:hypothetical protein
MQNSYYVPERHQKSPPLPLPPLTPEVPCIDHLPYADNYLSSASEVGAADQCESPLQLHTSQAGSSWPDPASAPFSASSSSLLPHIEAQTQVPPTFSLPYTNQVKFKYHPRSTIPPADSIPTSASPSPVNTTGPSSATATSPVTNTTNGSGNRKPPLACLFCRGRKIACRPPPSESTDKTCK